MEHHLDWLLATYCSPALAGIKPACLVSCERAVYPHLPETVAFYRRALADKGICFEMIGICPERYLLLVYQRRLLERYLSDPAVRRVLTGFDYPAGADFDGLLGHLKCRIVQMQDGDFPHEIGLFLGYPVEDVLGFIRHKGRDCKLSGYWKVYGDTEIASRLFHRFASVCSAVKKRLERGETLLDVFAA